MASAKAVSQLVVVTVVAYTIYHLIVTPETPPAGPAGGGPPPVTPAANVGTRDPSTAYALRAANTWPPLKEGAGSTRVTDDLLAVSYYVVMDGSGSMKDEGCSAGRPKIEVAREALVSFAASVPGDAYLGLAVFDQRGTGERLPLGLGNRDAFNQAVAQVQAGGGTPLHGAIELAYDRLLEQGRRQLGYGEYHLVVVTDGMASKGQDPTQAVNRLLAGSPVVLHTIGFCIGETHSLNQPGRAYYRAADNPDALRRGLEDVLAEAPAFDLVDFRH